MSIPFNDLTQPAQARSFRWVVFHAPGNRVPQFCGEMLDQLGVVLGQEIMAVRPSAQSLAIDSEIVRAWEGRLVREVEAYKLEHGQADVVDV